MTILIHFIDSLNRYDLLAAVIGSALGCLIGYMLTDFKNAPIFPQDYDLPSNHPASKKKGC
ncbi:hypothetical protein [Dyadobacter sp. 676]|uniref:YtxH domain-containing protein n=1 Tax=Dyadobacter sp. 676 TaxID=3088362 RepID=A0AAU8FMM8_9BACT